MRAWGRCGPAALLFCWQSILGRLGAMHLACRVHSSISRASDVSCYCTHLCTLPPDDGGGGGSSGAYQEALLSPGMNMLRCACKRTSTTSCNR